MRKRPSRYFIVKSILFKNRVTEPVISHYSDRDKEKNYNLCIFLSQCKILKIFHHPKAVEAPHMYQVCKQLNVIQLYQ